MYPLPPEKNQRILVAPLDWGLGHATRCIPLIRYLLQAGHTVLLAASGAQKTLLQQEFPALPCLDLVGYNIQYAKKGLVLALLAQGSRLLKLIAQEHRWLQQTILTHKIDVVISDNRYGLYSPSVPCILITHQLALPLPRGFGFAQGVVRPILYHFINRFAACWVPDTAEAHNSLSGKLGHPKVLPSITVHYMGWLSRFAPASDQQEICYKALIVLSGPEPQRTQLENLLLPQLKNTAHPIVLVRGLPGHTTSLEGLPAHITQHNHVGANELEQLFLQSKYIISRSGYSTLMDAFTLGKLCIFIPTPGQTEQEYLAKRMGEKKLALTRQQQGFMLEEVLKAAEKFDFGWPNE